MAAGKPEEEILKLFAEKPAHYADCRRQHDMKPIRCEPHGRNWYTTERCSRCLTEQDLVVDSRTGGIVDRPRRWQPPDYGVKGYGHDATAVIRGELRLRRFRPLIGKSPTTPKGPKPPRV